MAENPFPWEDGTALPPLPGTPAPQPPQAPYGQSPYGQPPPAPSPYAQPAYGQSPFGQPAGTQPESELPGLDAVLPPLEAEPRASEPPEPDDEEEDGEGVQARRANPWLFWLVPAVLLMVTGMGAVVFVVVRAGPKKADAASQGQPDWTQPLPDLPRIPTGDGSASSGQRGRRSDRPAAPVQLPRADDLDQSIRLIRQLAETQGAKFRAGKTAAQVHEAEFSRQPVEVELAATFPQVVAYLQRLHESLPHVRPVTLELSQEPQPADAATPLPAVLAFDCYFSAAPAKSRSKSRLSASAVLPGQPELAPALAQVAKAAAHRVAVLKMSLATAPAPEPPPYVEPTVTLEALAADEEDVERFVALLGRADRIADVTLVSEADIEIAGRLLRKCTVRFMITEAPEGAPVPLNAAVAPPQDVFRFARAFHEKAPLAPVKPPEPARPAGRIGLPAFDPADLVTSEYSIGLMEAKRLHLQSTLPGTKACIINGRLLRVGDRFDSFTVIDIGAGAATVRRGEHTYDITMRR